MSADKISVVVPAYNLAQYLPRCLDSILTQTYENLEVIVVDDGSRDDTFSIISRYAEKDSRVKAIHKENGGVTSARLRGIREATGEWIGFIDGDDEIEPHMYARLLENAHAHDADISHCGYQRRFPDGTAEYHYNTGTMHNQDRLTGLRDLLEERLVEPGLCSKLYRSELFRGLEEKMDTSIRNNEDMLMNYYLFAQASRSVYEDICPYHYILREDSASRRKLSEHRIYDPVRVRERILDVAEPELQEDALQALLRVLLYVYALLTVEKGGEMGLHMQKIRKKLISCADSFFLLSRRNQLLAKLICHAPWLFRIVFRAYVRIALKGHYE